MKKILGIDLGSNSIGAALVNQKFSSELADSGKRRLSTFELAGKWVRVFQEGVKIEKGVESSKAAERTAYRSARKLKFRRKLRKYETLKVLIEAGMCPLEMTELEKWRNYRNPESGKTETFHHYPKCQTFLDWLQCDRTEGVSPYCLRDKASRQKMDDLHQLGRVFYHLAQRRGFLSSRLDVQDESPVERHADELFALLYDSQHAAELSQLMDEYFLQLALDEEKELNRLYNFIKKVLADEKEYDQAKLRITRRLQSQENLGPVKREIQELTKAIEKAGCETAGQYYYRIEQQDFSHTPTEELPERLRKIRNQHMHREDHYLHEFQLICGVQGIGEELKKKLVNAIFFQRPLRSQKGLVAKCTLEPDKPRCPVSHPAFELYRMLGFINNIRCKANQTGSMEPLDNEQKKAIYSKFFRLTKKTFDFSDLKKELGKHLDFNYKDHYTVSGCPTIAVMMKWFGEDWRDTSWSTRSWSEICLQPLWQQNLHHALIHNHPSANKSKSVEEAVNDVWHVLQTFDKQDALLAYGLNKLGFGEKEALRFSKTRLVIGYGQLSFKAIKKILPYLVISGDVTSLGITKAKLEDIVIPEIWLNQPQRQNILDELAEIENHFGKDQHSARLANNLIKEHREQSNVPTDRPEIQSELLAKFKTQIAEIWGEGHTAIKNKSAEFKQNLKCGDFMPVLSKHDRIKKFLTDNDLVNSEKDIDKLYDPRSIGQFPPPVKDPETGRLLLNAPTISSVKNPMAMRALFQLKKLINTLIQEGHIDESTVIHLEMARELNDANKRKAIERYQREREQLHNKFRNEIRALYKEVSGKDIEPTDGDILSYELWKEQNQICLYSGLSLGISDILGQTSICEIEHTIPRSLSFDNSNENKTIASREANRDKGNRIPTELQQYDKIPARIDDWKSKYEQLHKEIEAIRRKTKTASTKEQKDRLIQEKHYKQMHLNYWKNKYRRFIIKEVPNGFKNSQLVDTGIITRFARNYLKTYFQQVKCIKGVVTAEFRKTWLNEDKSRDNHVHHLVDAVILACITGDRHDAFVQLYKAIEDDNKSKAKRIIAKSSPWPTFRTDLEKIAGDTIVSHHTPQNMESATRKRLRKRGKIQRNKKGEDIFMQGDSARGSLHKETFYGAVIPPDDPEKKIKYVVRKNLKDLSASDVNNIVDPVVKNIIQKAMADGDLEIRGGNLANRMESTIWMNEEKRIPINKVRCIMPKVAKPLRVKEHRDHKKQSEFRHKDYLMAVNDENYMMALYQAFDAKGNIKRDYEIIINMEAAAYLKTSNIDRKHNTIYPINKQKGKLLLSYYATLKKGTMVVLKQHEEEDIFALTDKERTARLYKVVGLEGDGRIQLRFHQEARMDKDLPKSSKPEFDKAPPPKLRISCSGFRGAIEGKDFAITPTGRITKPDHD